MSSPSPMPAYEDPDPSFLITNSKNVAGYCVSSNGKLYDMLILFIDLRKMEGIEYGRCESGKIGNIPVLLDVKLQSVQRAPAEKLIATLSAVEDSRQLGNHTTWSVEGSLLRIDIDTKEFAARSEQGGGESVELERIKGGRIGRSAILHLSVKFDPTSSGSWEASSAAVARQLNMNSMTPASPRRISSLSTSNDVTPIREEWALRGDLEGEFVEVAEALSVDTSNIAATKIIFFPESYQGNIFITDVNLFSEVAAHLSIEILGEGDPRLARRSRRREEEMVNLHISEVKDKTRNQAALVLTFNASEVYGKVESLMVSDLGVKSNSQLVSNCSKHRLGRYLVDFTATRAGATMPSEGEIYELVSESLAPLGKDMLANIKLEKLMQITEERYQFFFHCATEEELGMIRMRVWSCSRLYVIHKLMNFPPPSLDNVGQLIAGI